MDLQARRQLASGDTLQALSTWEAATSRHSVDQLMFGLTASLWQLRLDWAEIARIAGQPATALSVAGSFDRMAGVIDQVAWPEILRVKAAAALSANNMVLARTTYEQLAELLENANGGGIYLKDQAENQIANLGGLQ